MDRDAAKAWVRVLPDRQTLGRVAAAEIADELRAVLAREGSARVVFAAAPSQSETLAALAVAPGIDWGRVTAFHMDEYLGLEDDAPQRFGRWLQEAFFSRVPLAAVHLLDPGRDASDGALHYAELLSAGPIDVVCLGIGVNGHIAFNDPAEADFADPAVVKIVSLDDVCRQQQVDDLCFATLEQVPVAAITLTVPTLLNGSRLFCMVPGASKAEAARATVLDAISTDCPSTILRTHRACTLFLDADSAAGLRTTFAGQA